MANKKSINLCLGLNSTQFQKGLTKAQRRLKRFGSSMKRVGQSMTTSLTVPLVGIGAVAGKTFMDFEQSMLKVKAISGATGEEFKALEENAKALGSSTVLFIWSNTGCTCVLFTESISTVTCTNAPAGVCI